MKGPRLEFGTDGWRGRIAEEATFETYGRLARAAANIYRAGGFGPGDRDSIVIGYDPRFLSEEFAGVVAEIFSRIGIRVLLSDRPIPTPAVSFHVRRLALSGGISITASHNPAPDHGFKLKAHYGGSASPKLYARVEKEIDHPFHERGGRGAVERVDLWGPYRDALASRADVSSIRGAGLQVLADAMHGAAGTLLAETVGEGKTRIVSFRANRDVLFGGAHPEPIGSNLAAASQRVRREGFGLAVATDGDADRLGVLDSKGEFVSPHRILGLLLLHVFRNRGVRGGIARTFSTSLLIDRIAQRLGVSIEETDIGFKYVADLMISGKAAAGGEESGGYGFAFHLPERDGTLSALLLLESLARTAKSLDQALSDLDSEFGRFHYSRSDVRIPAETTARFLAHVAVSPPRRIAGHKVTSAKQRDGLKLFFGDSGWLLLRRSGTEPMIRLYCEHRDESACREILDRAGTRLAAFT